MTDTEKIGAQRLSLSAADGHRILVDIWRPAQPRILIHLFHGLGEHTARYERFAQFCNEAGIAIAAHSHRGHGENCSDEQLGHYADSDGWQRVLDDARTVNQHVAGQMADLPLVILGHSMGSYIAQAFVMRGYSYPAALILSGSTHAPRGQLVIGHWLAGLIRLGGRRRKSPLLNKMGFGDFNKRFAPARTDFDWLSRDEAEVDKYLNDRLCGAPSSAQLWYDLTGGLLETRSRNALRKVPADLPILITGGSDDPVGGRPGMQRLADAYQGSGHTKVSLRIYEQGRHEMFNETNRGEFFADLVEWTEKTITGSG